MLDTVRPDPESLGASAAEILSSLTGLPAISASAVDMAVRLRKVSLLPLSRGSAVVFVIADDGRSRSRLVRSNTPLTQDLAIRFDNLVREKVCGLEVSALDMAYLQSIVVSAGLDGQLIVSDGLWGSACVRLINPDGTSPEGAVNSPSPR